MTPSSPHQFALGFFCAIAAILALPAAAQIISDRFDGVYTGAARPASELTDPSCPILPLYRLEIRNGILRAFDDSNRQTVKGFVTGAGFFSSDYTFADGRTTLFEGRVDRKGRLTGGVVDGPCAWVVDLSRTR